MKTKYLKRLFVITLIVVLFGACNEGGRFEISSDDKVPPGQPKNVTYKPLNGGVRIFFTAPTDEDVLSVEAEFQSFKFAVSYFKDSVDVYGFADVADYTVKVYALDRAGNKSEPVSITVRPNESAISKIAKTVKVKPAFGAFLVDWENELGANVNVFIDFNYQQSGVKREFKSVVSSKSATDRAIISDLNLTPQELVSVKIRIGDLYGNLTQPIDGGNISLYTDVQIPKFDAQGNQIWRTPYEGEQPPFGGGVVQVNGNFFDGATAKVIDGLIDDGPIALNYLHANGQREWNYMIDMGDYYELSRIITHQRHTAEITERSYYYGDGNVGMYNMYRWDEETSQWEFISQHIIPVPDGLLSGLQWGKLGRAGDMAYMYPDEPRFSKPTRWFRYQALRGFGANYTNMNVDCLSEITLYGKKAGN